MYDSKTKRHRTDGLVPETIKKTGKANRPILQPSPICESESDRLVKTF